MELVLVACCEDEVVDSLIAELVSTHDVLLCGESSDGPYLGPMAREGSCSRDRPEWAFERRLSDLGLRRRPSELLDRVEEDPHGAANSVAALLGSHSQITLLDSLKTVRYPSPELVADADVAVLLEQQAWTYGLLRDAECRAGTVSGTYVTTCRTPAGQVERLESNSGKGLTPDQAWVTLVGEAVERSSAFAANGLRSVDPWETDDILPLEALHPYGPPWDECSTWPLAVQLERLEYVAGRRLHGADSVAVPKSLVAFPYITDQARGSLGVTSGLAAHTSWRQAVAAGLGELLERDTFYRNFLKLLPAERVDATEILLSMTIGLSPEDVWLLRWPESDLPSTCTVHAFVYDAKLGWFVRGSGSGMTEWAAAQSALLEAAQLHFQSTRAVHLGTPNAWHHGRITHALRGYLDGLQDTRAPEPRNEEPSTGIDLQGAVDSLIRSGRSPIVVDLPIAGTCWTTVRVLVPGLVTTPYETRSGAGSALNARQWPHAVLV